MADISKVFTPMPGVMQSLVSTVNFCIPNFFVQGSVICDLCAKKLGMQIELHRNNVYQGVELLLLVPMLFCWPFLNALQFLGRQRRPYIVFSFRF